jgi:serine/threonine protein kinase/tetratricopeptide (TPR) repeat protein
MTGIEPGDFADTDRFVVQGRLGAGGFGVVYRAIDRGRNIPVALKTLRNVAPKALVRFKQEFRALADVSHPNLVTLYELSSHEQQWFFTMELVDGVNFLWYVRGETYPDESGSTSAISRPSRSDRDPTWKRAQDEARVVKSASASALNLSRLRHALPQLAEGVEALHQAGLLHRDIKPSNVLVTREGRVVLLDFGLVAEIAPRQTNTLAGAGTPAYMSPEQVAGLPLTEASDWYNVGSMLYEALTGRLPFSGSVLEVMQRKQQEEPLPPGELSPDVPRDLGALCRDLLRRDPAHRPSGTDVLQTLKGVTRPGPDAPAAPPLPDSAPFVGRAQHLDVLRAAFQTIKSGRAVTVVVHGSSGMGKSALVRRFLEELKSTDAEVVVLAGRCYERESVPYKALDALIDALSRYLRRLPSAQAEGFLPHDILALALVFPVLRQVGAVSRARRAVLEIPDSFELRRRAFEALRELLVRLADRRPVVLFIDDLQWGDVDSAALLEHLMKPPDPPALLFIGSYRSEEAETSPLLKSVLPKRLAMASSLEMRDIVVSELSASEARELAVALAGGEPEGRGIRAEAIARESGGNPYFIEELARFPQAERETIGSGRPESTRDSPTRASEVTFDDVFDARVSRLPKSARRLLDVVAVSGVPIEVAVAYRAADIEKEAESVLAVLRAAHLVRTRTAPGGQEIETYHDRIREAVVAHLSAEALEGCHYRLASTLLASGRGDPETLARHSLGAGDAASAAEYAVAAGERASATLAFDRAADLYRFALNLTVVAPPAKAKLQVQLGDALVNAGRGAEAAQEYLSAAQVVDPALAIDLRRRAAQQFFMTGHIEEGRAALHTVLAKLGMKPPQTAWMALVSLLLRRAQIRLRGLRFEERDETEIPGPDLLRIDACWAVGVGMGPIDVVTGVDVQARHLVLALRAGEPYRIARALAMEATSVAMGGNRSRERAAHLLETAHSLAERVKHPYAIGLVTLASGSAAWFDGRWREALNLCTRAEEILRDRCAGVDWEILMAQLFRRGSNFFLGEVTALSQHVQGLLDEAEDRGNLLRAVSLRTSFCSHVVWLAADDPRKARQELETGLAGWRKDGFDFPRLWVRSAQTDIALYSGEIPAEGRSLGKASRAVARALDRMVQTGFIRGLETRARRRLAAAAQTASTSERDSLLRGAEGHAETILRQRTRWGDPLALLLRAGAAASRGETESALSLLVSAEAGFVAADMALYAAATRRRRGEVMGGDGGRELASAADAWMTGQSIRNPERMTAMLAPGAWRSG